MARSKNYRDLLIQDLKDPEDEAQKLLLLAIKNIVEAQGGIAQLAKKTGLGRESLYKTLSTKGNPKLSTLITVAYAIFPRR
ncbi:MAG TPA: hypothetical protein VHO47_00275 [Candidatus Babeliales bacterium]|nr:hypothetical protein [Candidatus Babeliales bacterium]